MLLVVLKLLVVRWLRRSWLLVVVGCIGCVGYFEDLCGLGEAGCWLLLVVIGCIEVACTKVAEEKLVTMVAAAKELNNCC